MDISAINDALFPVLLFALYLIGMSEFLPRSNPSPASVDNQNPPIQPTLQAIQEIEEIEKIEKSEEIDKEIEQNQPKHQVNLANLSIKDLRNYIKVQNLQSLIKQHIGKPYSRCSKSEL
ncbi:MAG: hypothetical protein AB4058_03185, partial [Microcystaceae cyanobacterium]